MKSRISQRWALLCVLACVVAGASGCSPKIGDKCSISTDCSQQGDRLCDPTQPGGYCTIFNCEPDRCPDEAVCVAFNEVSCSSADLSRRFQRTFCMLRCESNDDCRAGYTCLDTTSDPLREIVDTSPSSRKFCAVPSSGSPSPPSADPGVCLVPDASPPSITEAGTQSDAATPDATVEDATPMEGATLMEGATPMEGATSIEGGDAAAESSSEDGASEQ